MSIRFHPQLVLDGTPKTFYCREWVFAKIGHILDNRTAEKIQVANISGVLVVGEPGAGKTAVTLEIVRGGMGQQCRSLSNRVLASHFINGYEPETQSVAGFIRRLVDQLQESRLIDGYTDKLRHSELAEWLHPDRMERDPDESFQRAVLFPLLEMDTPPRNLLLIVDSLDEPSLVQDPGGFNGVRRLTDPTNCDGDSSQSIAELLANHHHLFPPWLLLLVTLRRSNKPLARLFTGFKKIALDQVRRNSVVRDVQQYILGRLEKEAALRRHLTRETAPALNMLHIKSHGCLLYVEAVLDGVADGSVLLRDIPEIPGTLNGLYLWLCQRLFTRRGWNKVQPLLATLLASRHPPSQEQLMRAAYTIDARMSRSEFRKRMNMLRKLLVPAASPDTSGGCVQIFHSSFGEWLTDVKHCTQRFLIKVSEGHARWAVTLASRGELMTPNEMEDLTFHLGRMQLQAPLEAWHLPLWLLWTKAPVPDKAVLQAVMVSSLGAHNLGLDDDVESQLDGTSPPLDLCVDPPVVAVVRPQEEKEDIGSRQQPEEAAPFVPEEDDSIAVASAVAVATEEEEENVITTSRLAAGLCRMSADPGEEEEIEESIEHNRGGGGGGEEEEEDEEEESPAVYPAAALLERRNSVRLLRHAHSLNEADDPEQSLFYAAQMGYTSAVTKLCNRYRTSISPAALRHALSIAARQGHASLVSILLEAGADPDVADSEGWTPLRASAWGGHASTVQVLLERGAQVDASDSEGRTALRAAAWAGHEEVVRALLNAGAQVDGEDRQGRTPLIAAAYMGHADIVAALLDAGAQPDHVDCEGRTALSVAVLSVACRTQSHNNPPSGANGGNSVRRRRPRVLLKRRPSKINSDDVLDQTAHDLPDTSSPPTEVAASIYSDSGITGTLTGTMTGTLDGEDNEAVETVTILLEYGASVNHQDKEGMTPLLVAAFEGHRTVCELLLETDADVDQADLGGRTPLLAAASMGHGHIVELLLFWGCYVDSIDAEGRTVLSIACAQGSVDVVRLLLDRGLDEAHRDNAGWTPLHYAAFEGHSAVVDLLLEVGARMEATDNDGRAPMLLATQEGHLSVVERLIELGADVDQKSLDGKTPLRVAALEGHTSVLSALVEAGADVTAKDPDGRSTLYLLAIENKLEQVEIILSKSGVKYNLEEDRDLEGRTPLHIASWQGHTAMVELLLRYGADVNAVDREQRTPLQSSAWQGHESVVWLLLKAGARGDQPCSQGATPLSIAAQEGHEGVARLLLASGADPNRADGCGRTALKLAMKGGHKKVIQLLENSSSTSSKSSEMGSRYLSVNGPDPTPKDYSPASTFETASCKSGSNLTSTSTPRSSSLTADLKASPSPSSVQTTQLSFTQQLQQQAGQQRGSRPRTAGLHLPLYSASRILSPLSEPQSPLYASPPPPTPPNEPAIWQPIHQTTSSTATTTASNTPQLQPQAPRPSAPLDHHRLVSVLSDRVSPMTGNVSIKNGQSRSSLTSLLRRERSEDAFRIASLAGSTTPPVPHRTSSVDPDRTQPTLRGIDILKNDSSSLRPSSVPLTQSSHMQIILGIPSKSRRNGFGHRPVVHPQSSRDSHHGGFSGMLAGIRNSALLHGSTKLKNALCNAVSRPVGVIKKETQL